MAITINPEKLVNIIKKPEDNKSDFTLLVEEMIDQIEGLHELCHKQLPTSLVMKDITRLIRSIDKLCFTIDNY